MTRLTDLRMSGGLQQHSGLFRRSTPDVSKHAKGQNSRGPEQQGSFEVLLIRGRRALNIRVRRSHGERTTLHTAQVLTRIQHRVSVSHELKIEVFLLLLLLLGFYMKLHHHLGRGKEREGERGGESGARQHEILRHTLSVRALHTWLLRPL